MSKLALFGGRAAVTVAHPHEPWPPKGTERELLEIGQQRNTDIGIRGNAGPVGEFETLFRERFAPTRPHVIAYNSGTSAMYAALTALGVGPGDAVIAPVLTYHAAISPARMLGADVIFADIDVSSRCLSPDDLLNRLNSQVRAIVVVHQWGHPADMSRIMTIAKRRGVAVVEDCSHAHGSSIEGQLVGTFGDAAIYSLQANKAVYAGEGGILVTSDQTIADRAILAGHYRDRAKADVKDADLGRFWASGFGMKLRISPFNAIVAKHSVLAFDALAEQRQQALSHFNEGLASSGLFEPLVVPSPRAMGAWYGFKPVAVDYVRQAIPRSVLVKALQAEGVEIDAPSGGLLSELPLFNRPSPVWRTNPEPRSSEDASSDMPSLDYPNGRFVDENAVSLPTFYQWPSDRVVIDMYVEAFAKVRASLDELIGRVPESGDSQDSKDRNIGLPRDSRQTGR